MKETNFKHTDIGLIPMDWERFQIFEIADTSSGGTPSRSNNSFYSGENRWFTTGELNDSYLYDSIEHISDSAIQNSSAKLFDKGTLLMAMYGATIGKLGILTERSTTNQACCAIMCKSVDVLFLFYLLLFHRQSIILQGSGAGQPNISQKIVRELTYYYPPTLDEQRCIAEALQNIDQLLDAMDAQIAKKQAIKTGAMQQLLTGKTRLAGFTEPWIEKRVGTIGYTYAGLTGKTKEDFGRGNSQYITFLNVLNNPVLNPSLFENVNVSSVEKQNKAHKNDLFFNTSSETPEEVGICSVLDVEIDNLYLNSFCFGFRITDPNVYGKYLAYFWRSARGREIMTTLAQGATRYNLSKVYFNAVVISVPNQIEEQKAIAEVLSNMDAEIQALQDERNKYALIKQGMMQELLTGKTRI